MKSKFKENFNFYTNVFLLFVIFFGGVIYADNNGIWHYASDIVPGIFGEDEGADSSNSFTFINLVNLNESTYYKGVEIDNRFVNEGQLNSINSGMIVDGSIKAVDVDSSQIQLLVNDICPSGSSIRAINSDGTVACQTDTVLTEAQVDSYVSNNGYLTSVSWNQVTDKPQIYTKSEVDSLILSLGSSGLPGATYTLSGSSCYSGDTILMYRHDTNSCVGTQAAAGETEAGWYDCEGATSCTTGNSGGWTTSSASYTCSYNNEYEYSRGGYRSSFCGLSSATCVSKDYVLCEVN